MTKTYQLLQNWNISGEVTDISDKGYSGSKIFKVNDSNNSYLLKGYPEHIKLNNLLKTHEILTIVKNNGIQFVPAPYTMKNGDTALEFENRAWDLVEFFSGEHLQADPNKEQFKNLILGVAKFHKATENVSIDENLRLEKPTRLHKIQEEFDWWDSLSVDKLNYLKSENLYSLFSEFIKLSKDLFHNELKNYKWEENFNHLPKYITHRDLTKRNTLFIGNKLTGIIDFESIRYGVRLTDVARLVIEFTDGKKNQINTLTDEYSKTNPLTDLEKESFITWIIMLNCGVNLWALRHYVDLHMANNEDHTNLLNRISKANIIYKNLMQSF